MIQADSQREDLSRIKEILFGEELQGLDARLGSLRDELAGIIENQIKNLEEKLKEQEISHKKQMEVFEQMLDKEKQDKKELEKTWQQMKTSIEENTTQHEVKLKTFLEKQQAQDKEAMKAMKDALSESIKKLEEDKVNKAEIAELFGLMIQKLK